MESHRDTFSAVLSEYPTSPTPSQINIAVRSPTSGLRPSLESAGISDEKEMAWCGHMKYPTAQYPSHPNSHLPIPHQKPVMRPAQFGTQCVPHWKQEEKLPHVS